MRKLEVEVTGHPDIKPEVGDVVQAIDEPAYFYFVSGRGDWKGRDKESRHTANAKIIDGKYDVCESWYYDENVRIVMRNGEPFEYPKKPDYTTEIDGVRYKLVPTE